MVPLLSLVTLSHNVIKEKLTELIEHTVKREGSLYLAYYEKRPFSLLNNLKHIICGRVRKCEHFATYSFCESMLWHK